MTISGAGFCADLSESCRDHCHAPPRLIKRSLCFTSSPALFNDKYAVPPHDDSVAATWSSQCQCCPTDLERYGSRIVASRAVEFYIAARPRCTINLTGRPTELGSYYRPRPSNLSTPIFILLMKPKETNASGVSMRWGKTAGPEDRPSTLAWRQSQWQAGSIKPGAVLVDLLVAFLSSMQYFGSRADQQAFQAVWFRHWSFRTRPKAVVVDTARACSIVAHALRRVRGV
ncbi:hypothetical protein FQR65_LT20356 [Abscondita terminalis]|nr:hypothetical protein FQR65_LT20356 [Abscondita terminalis]